MINLVKNELFKIFKKKSTFITILIFIGLLTLVNFALSYDVNSEYNDYRFSEENKSYVTETLQGLNPANADEVELYIETKTELEFINFCGKYAANSWQREVAQEYAYDIIYGIVDNTYLNKNNELLALGEAHLEELKNKLDANDFKSFMNDKKSLYESIIQDNKALLKIESDKSAIKELEKSTEIAKINLEVVEYRIKNDIKFDYSYLDEALRMYEADRISLLEFNTANMSKSQEKEYKNIQKEIALNKYVIDNKADINSYNTARNNLITVIPDEFVFIVIFVTMIAGAIVAEEFSKGTIKMLLIRPFGRMKILLSKYITCIIMLLFITAVIVLGQFLLGGLFLGFDSYSIPAISYDFAAGKLIEMSIIKCILIDFLALLPMFLLLMTLAFAISTIFTSTALAVTITLLTSFFSDVINALIITYNIKVLKFFPTMCWNLSSFMYGGQHEFEPMTFNLCLIMSIVYLLILILMSFIIFKKKNVKNI